MNWNKLTYIIFLLSTLLYVILCGCSEKRIHPFYQIPTFEEEVYFTFETDTLIPHKVQYVKDTLFVSFTDKPFIMMYDTLYNSLGLIPLIDKEKVIPTNFHVSDSFIFVCDLFNNRLITYTINGDVVSSFDRLPDEETPIEPVSVFNYGGVSYVNDIGTKKLLAISSVTVDNLTMSGELILTIPSDSTPFMQFPSVSLVTYEGRAVVADAETGKIHSFTCTGDYMYDFDTIEEYDSQVITAIDLDNILDPELVRKDSSSFDPSGIRNMGRFHMLDVKNRKIHMFNPLGHYIQSYPDKSYLQKPTGMTIDVSGRNIYIADQESRSVIRFSY